MRFLSSAGQLFSSHFVRDLRTCVHGNCPRTDELMARIFISYRREGGSGFSGRLAEDLERRFGAMEVFRDVEDIASGDDFVERLGSALCGCRVLVAVLDKTWLSASNIHGRRLDDPKDFVRTEIATALSNGVRVIPVLVEGATMPSEEDLPSNIKPLARRQAHELSDSRWDYDVDKLATAIDKVLADGAEKNKRPTHRWRALMAVAAVALAVGASVVVWFSYSRTPDLNGTWYLPDGGYWSIQQNGRDIKIDVVHHDTHEVWQRGRGIIHGGALSFHLDLVYQSGHSVEGQLTIDSHSKRLTGQALGSPLGNRNTILLQRR